MRLIDHTPKIDRPHTEGSLVVTHLKPLPKNLLVSLGLKSEEARRRLERGGPNAMVDVAQHPVRRALGKLWAPVPWMLEAAIVLQIGLGEDVEAGVAALTLGFPTT